MPRGSNRRTLIEDTKARHVTFSKRRSGIFKKASELCTLCAVEIAIIIFSPAGKAHSFGNPSPNYVINHLTNFNNPHSINMNVYHRLRPRPQQEAVEADLCKKCFDLHARFKEEKKRGKILKEQLAMIDFGDVEKMNKEELIKFKASLEELKRKVEEQKKKTETVDVNLSLGGIYSVG